MKIPYEKPEVEVIDFRALERLASDEVTGPNIDLEEDYTSEITGGVDWEW